MTNWYQGKFGIARGFLTFILALIATWFLVLCFAELRLNLYKCYKCCCYKTATVIPIPIANTTDEPTNGHAKEIHINTHVLIV
jgi:hypothetical protein